MDIRKEPVLGGQGQEMENDKVEAGSPGEVE